jgi:hypothetical protein
MIIAAMGRQEEGEEDRDEKFCEAELLPIGGLFSKKKTSLYGELVRSSCG